MITGNQEKRPMERPRCLFCDALLRIGHFGPYCPICEPEKPSGNPEPDDDNDDHDD